MDQLTQKLSAAQRELDDLRARLRDRESEQVCHVHTLSGIGTVCECFGDFGDRESEQGVQT